MSIRNRVALFTSVCLLLLCSLTVLAQSQTTGSVEGVVKDSNGAVVVGAEVVVTSMATGDERRVTTSESGAYAVPLLSPGSYRIQINASGFRQVAFEDVTVSITETTTIPVELIVGGLMSESVIINASVGPIVQSDSSQLGRVVDSRTVAELPLATRNFTQILGLSTGTATYLPDNTAVGRNSQTFRSTAGASRTTTSKSTALTPTRRAPTPRLRSQSLRPNQSRSSRSRLRSTMRPSDAPAAATCKLSPSQARTISAAASMNIFATKS